MISADTSQKVLNAFLAANPGVRNKGTTPAANSAALSAFLAANPKFLERSGAAGSEAASGLGTQLSGTSATDALREELETLVNSPQRPVPSSETSATESKKPEISTPGSPSKKAGADKPAAKETEKPSSPKKVDAAVTSPHLASPLKPAAFALLPESEILKNLLGVQGPAQAPTQPAQKEARGTSSPAKENAKPAAGKASAAPEVAKVAKDAAVPQSPKKERNPNAKDAATSPGPVGKQSPVTVAWKPKVDDKSVSPKREGTGTLERKDVKTASPKKEGPAAKDTGKGKPAAEVSEKPQGPKKVPKAGTQDGILTLLESAFAKFEGAPAPAAKTAAEGEGHEYSISELLRLRSKTTRRLKELPYRVVAAKTDGELLDVPQPKEKSERRSEKPSAQPKPVSRGKDSAPAPAQSVYVKRDKSGADTVVQPAAKKKPAEKSSQSFVWKPKS
jgi:hypothetical protein